MTRSFSLEAVQASEYPEMVKDFLAAEAAREPGPLQHRSEIDTDMVRAIAPEVLEKIVAKIPVKKLGTTENVARLVAFLADDANAFTTGATFSVNGGQYLS